MAAALDMEKALNKMKRQLGKEKEIAVAETKKKKWVRVCIFTRNLTSSRRLNVNFC